MVGLSFILINLTGWVGILIVGMTVLSFGEMIAFPFSNSFALKRAEKGKQGSYMAMYSIAFSISHIFGHNTGMQLMGKFGYDFTWYVMAGVCLVSCALLIWVFAMVKKEKQELPVNYHRI